MSVGDVGGDAGAGGGEGGEGGGAGDGACSGAGTVTAAALSWRASGVLAAESEANRLVTEEKREKSEKPAALASFSNVPTAGLSV